MILGDREGLDTAQAGAVRVAIASTAGFALLLHLAVAGRLGFFRDELYFIACGRHPAFGYVDQPPLIPLIAAATQLFGHDLVLLRAVPALAAAATVVTACLLARFVGGGPYAVALTGITVSTAPMLIGIDGTLNTSSFEPLAWVLLAYFLTRAAAGGERSALLWSGAVIGLALEAKYQIVFYAVPLLAGLLLTPQRRVLWSRETVAGIAIAVVTAAPSVVWQGLHGFPFAQLILAGASGKNAVQSLPAFALNQLGVMNLLFAPIWICGVVAPLISKRLMPVRFLAYGFILTFVLMVALHAKDYYLAGLYAPAFAVGAVAAERFLRATPVRIAYPVVGVAFAAVAWPNALPLLNPPALAAYLDRLPFLRPQIQEKAEQREVIPQNLADQLGWPELARDVAAVYDALPPSERTRTAIIASNYGEAGALDFFGSSYGLPLALSGHNQYWLWGTHGYDGSTIVYVNSHDVGWWNKRCREAHVAGTFGHSPYVEPYERDRPIVLCRGFAQPLDKAWPTFKNYE